MLSENLNFNIINGLKTRPGSQDGLWVFFLLPVAIIIAAIRHPLVLTSAYKSASIFCIGLILVSCTILFQRYKTQRLKTRNVWILLSLICTSLLFHICVKKDWYFSILSGMFSTIFYFKIFKCLLVRCKECFSLGEAGIISQSISIFLYFSISNILNNCIKPGEIKSNMQISTLIIQLGLLGISTVALLTYIFNIRGVKTFYICATIVIIMVILVPLHVFLRRSPLMWILNQIDDISTIKLMIYWSFCCGIAVLAVSNQIFNARKASTCTRKIFHLLAVAVYIPGLLYRCSLLYLATGIVFGIFLAFEMLRILHMPPLGNHLQDGFAVFSDEKDTGNLALTPMYLLAGCSLPIWIHPSPCDTVDSALFNLVPLLSGLLTIGIGDTAASYFGFNYGRCYWPGSKKTIEGTMACIIAQAGVVYSLVYFGVIYNIKLEDLIRIGLGILVSSLVEAKTTQVDNLVLPLIMFIITI